MSKIAKILGVLFLAVVCVPVLRADTINVLSNTTFTAGPTSSGQAAANWWLVNATSQILPYDANSNELLVTTSASGGILQLFPPVTANITSSVWVYVVYGVVGMGTGNGGATGYDAVTHTTGSWVQLTAPAGSYPGNEFIVFSQGPAQFYVHDPIVDPPTEAPEPASLALLGSGFVAVAARVRSRLKK